MINAEQAWREQDDVAALCASIDKFETVETFASNAGYGFARILKEYSGYPLDKPIRAVVPHGVYLDASKMLEQEARSEERAVLNYPAFRSPVWEAQPDCDVVPAASPFLYALEQFRAQFEVPKERSGTIFFAAHSASGSRLETEWDAVAEELVSLEERFLPVTVCVHSRDYHAGLHKPFEKRGMSVVSAGNVGRPDFIYLLAPSS